MRVGNDITWDESSGIAIRTSRPFYPARAKPDLEPSGRLLQSNGVCQVKREPEFVEGKMPEEKKKDK